MQSAVVRTWAWFNTGRTLVLNSRSIRLMWDLFLALSTNMSHLSLTYYRTVKHAIINDQQVNLTKHHHTDMTLSKTSSGILPCSEYTSWVIPYSSVKCLVSGADPGPQQTVHKWSVINPVIGSQYYHQACGYLPRHRASLPFDWYQLVLHGNRSTWGGKNSLKIVKCYGQDLNLWPIDQETGTLPLGYKAPTMYYGIIVAILRHSVF